MPDFADEPTSELERKVKALAWACIIETATFVLLQILWLGVHSVIGVQLLGSIHGMTFLAFAAMTYGVHKPMGWDLRYVIIVVVLGPIGAVMVYERIRREGVSPEAIAASRPRAGAVRPVAATQPAVAPAGDDARGGAPTPSDRPTHRLPGA